MQLAEVRHTALGEVDVGLQRNARGDGGMAHQLGVGRLLAADDDRRDAARDDGVDAVLPGPVAAEDPHHGQIGAVELFGELTVDEPRRIGPPVMRTARTRGDQVGVGCRQQQNGGVWHSSFVPHALFDTAV